MTDTPASPEPAEPAETTTPTAQVLVGVSFDDTFRAQEFLTAAAGLSARGALVLKDAVLVHKDEGGHAHVKETTDIQTGPAAMSGALWAGLFGLILGGPVGWVAGIAIGAGAGAATAKLVDLGISDEWVDWFKQAVEPGGTIVALLVEELDRDALVTELARFGGADLVYANLDEFTIDRLEAALGEHVTHQPHPGA